MKELKDIVLKKGDIVYSVDKKCDTPRRFEITEDNNVRASLFYRERIITKIERPIKYETIYEAPEEILTKEEKEYLEAVIRPFRDRVKYIKNTHAHDSLCFISIILTDKLQKDLNEAICLPFFNVDTMYKGMELDKEYTLDELGLFKE